MLTAAMIMSCGALAVALIDDRVPVFEIVVCQPLLIVSSWRMYHMLVRTSYVPELTDLSRSRARMHITKRREERRA